MKQTIDKVKNSWNKFKSGHEMTSTFLPYSLIAGGLTAVLTGAAYLSFLAFPPTVPVYLVLTLVATAAGIETGFFGALTGLSYNMERKTSFTNQQGEALEGPNWAVRKLANTEKKLKQLFNKQAAVNADPEVAEAKAAVSPKASASPDKSAPRL